MIQQFVNRSAELKFLERKYAESPAQMIIIYGRRRVGKTELIKKFIQEKKALYFLCTRDSLPENSRELKRRFYEFTGKEYFLELETDSFFDLVKYLVEIESELIIVFDEFPYLIELDRGITSVFQKMWDELLKDKQVFMILSGSRVGMMETEVLGSRSPLYGRRTGDWKVEPFAFADVAGMFGEFSIEDCVKLWSVFGGTPFYLSQVNPKLPVEENIGDKVLRKGEILYSEPKILLRKEFREPKTYTLILKYLSLGYNSHGELSSAAGIEKGNLSKYLSVLEETHLVRYVLPLGRRKRGIYVINDPFFNFWFRFVYPNLSDLEIGLVGEVLERIAPQLNSYYGLMFEQVVFDLIRTKRVKLPFEFSEARKWWHKDKEIDVVVLMEQTKQILFAECKWQEGVNAEKVLAELKEKSQHVKWNKGKEEYFAVFAKSFRKKVEGPDLRLFDLKDLEKLTRKGSRARES